MIEAIFQNIKDGQNKRETAISKQAFDELSQRNNDESEWKEIIKNLVNEAQIVVRSSSQVEKEIEDLYTSTYCTDIYTYEKAKKLRSDRFKETCFARIDAAISKKKQAVFSYKDLTSMIMKINEDISDKRYTVDISELKPKKEKKARQILATGRQREIAQLKCVKNDEDFLIRELTRELFYKDFREVYVNTDKNIDILNLEEDAFANFEDTQEEMELMGDNSPAKLFFATVKRPLLAHSIFPGGPIYQHGCYVFMTGDDNAQREKQISWKEK